MNLYDAGHHLGYGYVLYFITSGVMMVNGWSSLMTLKMMSRDAWSLLLSIVAIGTFAAAFTHANQADGAQYPLLITRYTRTRTHVRTVVDITIAIPSFIHRCVLFLALYSMCYI